ncbi:MAG: response regulator [Bacteroidetes bacterium]|nr:response regulator [Bacteroidota bacterium]
MKKIVLVDDAPIANFIMKRLINTAMPEATVTDFTSSQAALDALDSIQPDIIFLDLNMPLMNGWEFLEGMKAREMYYKVVILSSSTSELDRQQSINYSNVAGYFVKPLEKTQIVQILRGMIL